MKLMNFHLKDPMSTVELVSDDDTWDLHNFAHFHGLRLAPNGDTVMVWKAGDSGEPSAGKRGRDGGCSLVFRSIQYLHVTGRDQDMPTSEDATLDEVTMVTLEGGEFRRQTKWKEDEPFRLLFEFRGGVRVEIESETVELVPDKTT
jgi:hypothetical protein